MELRTPKNTNQAVVCPSPILLSELIKICGDDDVIFAVLQAFLEDVPEIFRCLDQAMQTKDCSQIALYSHRMKSSSRNIGAMDLSAVSLKMELQAKENNLKSMAEDYAEMKRLYDQLRIFVSNNNWLDELKKDAGQL
jgi:HPt (histidine-containing phosphotransfer) domain-containing protein